MSTASDKKQHSAPSHKETLKSHHSRIDTERSKAAAEHEKLHDLIVEIQKMDMPTTPAFRKHMDKTQEQSSKLGGVLVALSDLKHPEISES